MGTTRQSNPFIVITILRSRPETNMYIEKEILENSLVGHKICSRGNRLDFSLAEITFISHKRISKYLLSPVYGQKILAG